MKIKITIKINYNKRKIVKKLKEKFKNYDATNMTNRMISNGLCIHD